MCPVQSKQNKSLKFTLLYYIAQIHKLFCISSWFRANNQINFSKFVPTPKHWQCNNGILIKYACPWTYLGLFNKKHFCCNLSVKHMFRSLLLNTSKRKKETENCFLSSIAYSKHTYQWFTHQWFGKNIRHNLQLPFKMHAAEHCTERSISLGQPLSQHCNTNQQVLASSQHAFK